MNWLNYHHLLYFWTTVRQGSVTEAAVKLGLTQPTVSGQLRALEEALGEKLFERRGRGLKLTAAGTLVYGYADEIFTLGKEMQATLKGRSTGRPLRLHVGLSDSLPKLVTYRLLSPALQMDPEVQLVCHENSTAHLLANLSINGLDLVLSDEPLGSGSNVKAYNHPLGESGISVFGTAKLARAYRKDFPRCLDAAPFLLPMEGTGMRVSLERWFGELGIAPKTVAEFSDSALLKVFGEHGAALFVAPSVIEKDVCDTYGVQVVGRSDWVKERFYAISVERRIKHPAVAAITREARQILFGGSKARTH